MLTEDVNIVNNSLAISKKFANITYNKMLSKRYGVKPCRDCGDMDNIGGRNRHVVRYERMVLSTYNDCGLYETIPCKEKDDKEDK